MRCLIGVFAIVSLLAACGGGGSESEELLPGGSSSSSSSSSTSTSSGNPQADACPSNGLKDAPGMCGCDTPDEDIDNDGVTDCLATPGWTDPRSFLVTSDGSRSLGDNQASFNDTRDQGSKLAYFDAENGDNESADVYWWDGEKLVDSAGNASNPANGEAYGSDPLQPNRTAIKPFRALLANGDPRLLAQDGNNAEANNWRFSGLSGGYPDWFLFRRGQVHTDFDRKLTGGRSEAEPMVVAAWGPPTDGRAIVDPAEGMTNPFGGHNWGYAQSWLHHAIFSIEMHTGYGYVSVNLADSFAGGPVTAFLEDCLWPERVGGQIVYPPTKTTIRRSIVRHTWKPDAHNQAYYTSGFKNQVTMDEVILYKNGYKTNPVTDPDPKRDIFSRNIYQGGGAKLGHVYRNIISMDGASGGPQMRLGGVLENSLIVEGYVYSSTNSNSYVNDWMESEGQVGQSARVRNNVQLIYAYPNEADPDTEDKSDSRAQPGWGYALQGASFGAVVEGNIISGAMLRDELAGSPRRGINLASNFNEYEGGATFSQKNNVLRDNILYRVGYGFEVEGDATSFDNVRIENNIAVADNTVNLRASNSDSATGLVFSGNRFYSDGELTVDAQTNEQYPEAEAASREGWPDPDRTLRRYVEEVLGLSLLDWSDNPNYSTADTSVRQNAGEIYDPAGMKTFMAVAANMRYGGRDAVPESGKPSMTADYAWDQRFTAVAVVNWIRAGFGLEAVQ